MNRNLYGKGISLVRIFLDGFFKVMNGKGKIYYSDVGIYNGKWKTEKNWVKEKKFYLMREYAKVFEKINIMGYIN